MGLTRRRLAALMAALFLLLAPVAACADPAPEAAAEAAAAEEEAAAQEQAASMPGPQITGVTTDTIEVYRSANATLPVEMSYVGLSPSRAYYVTAWFIDQTTGLPSETVTCSMVQPLTPAASDGSVRLDLPIYTDNLVVTTAMMPVLAIQGEGGVTITQSVEAPIVTFIVPTVTQTLLTSGGKTAAEGDRATLVQMITYTGLQPAATYTVLGTLCIGNLDNPAMNEDGKPITAESTFVPSTTSGQVVLMYNVDPQSFNGADVFSTWSISSGGEVISTLAPELAPTQPRVTLGVYEPEPTPTPEPTEEPTPTPEPTEEPTPEPVVDDTPPPEATYGGLNMMQIVLIVAIAGVAGVLAFLIYKKVRR